MSAARTRPIESSDASAPKYISLGTVHPIIPVRACEAVIIQAEQDKERTPAVNTLIDSLNQASQTWWSYIVQAIWQGSLVALVIVGGTGLPHGPASMERSKRRR